MTISFVLPNGESQTYWVTRRQWLFLIIRISDPERLPKQVLGKVDLSEQKKGGGVYRTSSEASESNEVPVQMSGYDPEAGEWEKGVLKRLNDPDTPLMVERIGIVRIENVVRISFVSSTSDSIGSTDLGSPSVSLTLTLEECMVFESMLRSKAQQAGWDLASALKRLEAHLEKRQGISKQMVH